MKRILSIALALCVLLSCAALLGGCSQEESKDWPVTIGDVTIDKEPENLVVLSDGVADIVSYLGYDIKMVGRAAEVDQDFLYVVPVMGSVTNPDVNAITAAGTDLVLADSSLSDASKQAIEAAGVKVVTMTTPANDEELKSLYVSVGTVLGGNTTGAEKGEKGYDELIDTLDTFKDAVNTDIVQTTVYLYLDANGQLCSFPANTLSHRFFGYNGGTNVLLNQAQPAVATSELRLSSPAYIFYDTPDVLAYLSMNDDTANLSGLVNGHTLEIPKKSFERYGTTIEQTVYKMLNYIETITKATADEAVKAEPTKAPAAATEAEEAPADETPAEEVYDDAYTEDYAY